MSKSGVLLGTLSCGPNNEIEILSSRPVQVPGRWPTACIGRSLNLVTRVRGTRVQIATQDQLAVRESRGIRGASWLETLETDLDLCSSF
jgi:hypothetical protein